MSVLIYKKPSVNNILDEIKTKALECVAVKNQLSNGFTFEALHPYLKENGELIYSKIRLRNISTGEKWIRPIKYQNGEIDFHEPKFSDYGFKNGKPLYRLELLNKYPEALVYLVEGEKAADALNAYFEKSCHNNRYIAVTSGGASSADGADFTPLAKRKVICWSDNDDAGQKYVEKATLHLIELESDVEWVAVEDLNLPDGGDAADWLESNKDANLYEFEGISKVTPDLTQEIKPLFDIADARVSKFIKTPPPPRRYLLDKCLPLGKVGLIVGMGGVRKSMLMMQLQMALATDMALCGHWSIGESGASLGLYAEEDEEELHRRLHFAMENYKPDVEKLILENVYIKSGLPTLS